MDVCSSSPIGCYNIFYSICGGPLVELVYFIASMLGGFFIIAIPWSGVLLIMARRDKSQGTAQEGLS
jgi:hypothetical protein